MISKIRWYNNTGVRILKNESVDVRSDDAINHFRQALALQHALEQQQEQIEQPYPPPPLPHSEANTLDPKTVQINESSLCRRRYRCVSPSEGVDDVDNTHSMPRNKLMRTTGSGDNGNTCSSSITDMSTVNPYVPYLYLRPFLLQPHAVETDIDASKSNHVVSEISTGSYNHIWDSIVLIWNLAMMYHASDRSSNKAVSLYKVALSLHQSIPSSSSFVNSTSSYHFVSVVLYNNYISWCFENHTEGDDGTLVRDWMDRLHHLIHHTHGENYYSNNSNSKNDDESLQIRYHVQDNLEAMTAMFPHSR